MLRKIKSHAFLSPKKTATPAQPATSPVRVYGLRSSSPTKTCSGAYPSSCHAQWPECVVCHEALIDHSRSVLARGCRHRYHLKCAKESSGCPKCAKSPQMRSEKTSRIKSKASSWFGLTPVKKIAAVATNYVDRTKEIQPSIQILQTSLYSEFHCVSSKREELLILLHTQSTLPILQRGHRGRASIGKSFVLILDGSATINSRLQTTRIRETALIILNELSPCDVLSVISNSSGTDEHRVVHQDTRPLVESREGFSDAISQTNDNKCSPLVDNCDSFAQAIRTLVQQALSDKPYIIYISDGLTTMSQELLSNLQHSLTTFGITLYTIGVGAVIDSVAMRKLAHCSINGTFLPGVDESTLSNVFSHIANATYLAPLEEIRLDIRLYDGASVRECRHAGIECRVMSPQHIQLIIPRLGVCESHQVLILVLLPRQGNPRESDVVQDILAPLQSDRNGSQVLHDSLGASGRLAELEDLVNCLPSKLANCEASYSHPLFHELSRVLDAPKPVMIKRSSDSAEEVAEYGVVEIATIQEVQQILLESQRRKDGRSDGLRLELLNRAEDKVHDFSRMYETSSSVFLDLLECIRQSRSDCIMQQHVTRLEVHRRCPSEDDAGGVFPGQFSSGPSTRIVHKLTTPIDRSPSPLSNRKLSTLEECFTNNAKIKMSSTGSTFISPRMSDSSDGANVPTESRRGNREKPMLSCLTSSQEVRKIVRRAASQQHRECANTTSPSRDPTYDRERMHRLPRAELDDFIEDQQRIRHLDQDDYAQRIWHSHKEERGESSMLSEDDIRIDLDNLHKEDLLDDLKLPEDDPENHTSSENCSYEFSFGLSDLRIGTTAETSVLDGHGGPDTDECTPTRIVRFTSSTTAVDNDSASAPGFLPAEERGHRDVSYFEPSSSRYSSVPDV